MRFKQGSSVKLTTELACPLKDLDLSDFATPESHLGKFFLFRMFYKLQRFAFAFTFSYIFICCWLLPDNYPNNLLPKIKNFYSATGKIVMPWSEND